MIYVDILKCATTTKVMAAALGGTQCPTTQVRLKLYLYDHILLVPVRLTRVT